MEYDPVTAFHYAAFRPDLHGPILAQCLGAGKIYATGLDVGCGTGQSAIALSTNCEKVVGVEPSTAMLEKTLSHPKVSYLLFNGRDIDFPENTFDLIAFAGSLYYAKSQSLLDEVLRVCKDGGKIIVYDFDISLEGILGSLGADLAAIPESGYDHQVDFSGLTQPGLTLEKRLKTSLPLEIALTDLAHLLLSVKAYYCALVATFGRDGLYDSLVKKLFVLYTSESTLVQAKAFATVYTQAK